MTSSRPFPPLTDGEAWDVLHALPNTGDRLLVRVLLDFDQGGPMGAYPGYKLIAQRTGWSGKTVRNRLSRLLQTGIIVSERGGAQGWTRYYVVPLMSRDVGTPDSPSMSRGECQVHHPLSSGVECWGGPLDGIVVPALEVGLVFYVVPTHRGQLPARIVDGDIRPFPWHRVSGAYMLKRLDTEDNVPGLTYDWFEAAALAPSVLTASLGGGGQ